MQTISRASSRKSQAESGQSKQAERGQSSCSDSEAEEAKTRTSDIDHNHVDISDDKGWDTDLEQDGECCCCRWWWWWWWWLWCLMVIDCRDNDL